MPSAVRHLREWIAASPFCGLNDGSRTFIRQFEVSTMSDPLVTYLNDHLGGAQTAVQVLKAMRDQHDEARFREFAGVLLPEIQADDGTHRSIAEKIGPGPSATKQF